MERGQDLQVMTKKANMDQSKFGKKDILSSVLLYRPPKGGGTFAKQQGYKVKKLCSVANS